VLLGLFDFAFCRTTHVLAGAKMNELKARNNWNL
jgi:hypothetical protein